MATELVPNTENIKIENEPLLYKDTKYSKQWSTSQLVLFITIAIIISCIASNMDRIIAEIKSDSDDTLIDSDKKLDIMVVGGGISGLSTLHFISSSPNYKDTKILLIEKLNRIGGRAFSYNIEYKNRTIVCEGGAIRGSMSNYYFSRMIYRLGICDQVIPANSIQTTLNSTKYFYRNKKQTNLYSNTNEYFKNIFNFNPNYDIDDNNWIYSVNDLLSYGWNQVLIENNNGNEPETEEEWMAFRTNWTLNGELLTKWNIQTYMKYYMNISREWWDYRHTTNSFGSIPKDSIMTKMYDVFGGPDEYNSPNVTNSGYPSDLYTMKNGYNEITWNLYRNITENNQNHNILLNHELVSVDYSNDNNYKYIVRVYHSDNDEFINYYTNNIILSISSGSLRDILSNIKPIYNEYVTDLVSSVVSLSSYKINLIFDDEWIINNIKNENEIVTDLAIRTYLFNNLWINGTLTAMHIYSFTEFRTDYFNELQQLGTPNNLYENQDVIIRDNYTKSSLIPASKYLVDEVMKELRLLTNYTNIPYPIAAYAHPMNWKYGNIVDGAYQWKYGYDHKKVMNDILKPMEKENIYISSADYSYEAGMHSGGIQVALEIAKKYFNVQDPFINADYCKYSENGSLNNY